MVSPKRRSSRPPKRRGRRGALPREDDPVATSRELGAAQAFTYEVQLEAGGFTGHTVLGGGPNVPKRSACHEAFFSASEPCPECPVLVLASTPPARREGRVIATTPQGYRVAVAESLGTGRYRVAQLHMPEHVVTELQRARIERVARRAKLSRREKAVLDLVLLGRTSAEVAHALGIAERTARFHVGNIFAKLQADSRSDLFRLLL